MADKYQTGFFILLSILMLGLGAGGAWYYFNRTKTEVDQTKVADITASPSSYLNPTPAITITTSLPSPEPTQNIVSDLELIRTAMASKYSKDPNDVNITIDDNNGAYAKGGVSFAGEMGGGWFLAAKTNQQWVIVDDGNGTVSCDLISPYNFPVAMVSECVNSSGELIYR